MEIRLDTKAYCTDGEAGRVTRLVLNPDTDEVTHVVVERQGKGLDPVMVPIEALKESDAERVLLKIDRAALDRLPSFLVHDVQTVERPRPPGQTLQSEGYMTGPTFDLPQTEVFDVTHERVPRGELAVQPGAKVHATDGHVGEVHDFLVDLAEGRLSHLVLREGHFWGRRDVQIPVGSIQRIEERDVYLDLTKDQIEALPSVRAR
jgi:sporulation protein YlmC with PRC-barrel domain